MSPTVFRIKNFRFFFFSKEESRIHVHVASADGEAKFWIDPMVALAERELETIFKEHAKEIEQAWKRHFSC